MKIEMMKLASNSYAREFSVTLSLCLQSDACKQAIYSIDNLIFPTHKKYSETRTGVLNVCYADGFFIFFKFLLRRTHNNQHINMPASSQFITDYYVSGILTFF